MKTIIQGQTIPKPNDLVVDVTSSHQGGMVRRLFFCCNYQPITRPPSQLQ